MKTQSVSLSRTEQAAKLQCHKLAKKIWPRHYVWIEYDSRAPESNEARVAAREATAAIKAEREAHSKQLLPEGQRVAEFEAVIAAAEFVRDLPGDPTAIAALMKSIEPFRKRLADREKTLELAERLKAVKRSDYCWRVTISQQARNVDAVGAMFRPVEISANSYAEALEKLRKRLK